MIKSIRSLIDHDEEPCDILGEVGFVKNMIKSEKFPPFTYLCVFSEQVLDHQAAVKLAKSISTVLSKKELGVVEPNALAD